MIDELVPPAVAVAETFHDPLALELLSGEEACVARAVDKRRREFATVRLCARTALARLGIDPVPIVPGLGGSPRWPTGIVGSMTHCADYRAAAVARSEQVVTIGIDAEPNEPLPDGVLDAVALDEERAAVTALTRRRPEVSWDRLMFSAKESVYKAWFPLTLHWLDFEQVVVTIDPCAGTFSARLRVAGPVVGGRELDAFRGCWLVRQGLTITAITVLRASAAGASSARSGLG